MLSQDIYQTGIAPNNNVNPKYNGVIWEDYSKDKQPYICLDSTQNVNRWEIINNPKLKMLEDYISNPTPPKAPGDMGVLHPNAQLTFGVTIQIDDIGGWELDILNHKLTGWGRVWAGHHVDRIKWVYGSNSIQTDGTIKATEVNLRFPDRKTTIFDMRPYGLPTRKMWGWDDPEQRSKLLNPNNWQVTGYRWRVSYWGSPSDAYNEWPHFRHVNELHKVYWYTYTNWKKSFHTNLGIIYHISKNNTIFIKHVITDQYDDPTRICVLVRFNPMY